MGMVVMSMHLVVEAIQVNDPDTALDNLGHILHGGLQILLQTTPKQLWLTSGQGSAYSPPGGDLSN